MGAGCWPGTCRTPRPEGSSALTSHALSLRTHTPCAVRHTDTLRAFLEPERPTRCLRTDTPPADLAGSRLATCPCARINGKPTPVHVASAHSRTVWEPSPPRKSPHCRTVIMGSYLSRGKTTLPPPDGARQSPPPRPARHQRGCDQCRVTHDHLKCRVCNKLLSTTPPSLNYARVRRAMAPEAGRRLPGRPPLCSFTGPNLSSSEETFRRQWLWNARNPQRIRSPVTVMIAPPEREGSLYRCAPLQEPPDPCAKETVLRALSQCKKGKKKFDGPLWFEIPDAEGTQPSPERRPSAFRPVLRNGETLPFVPRPGPLRRAPEGTAPRQLTASLPEPPPSAARPAARTPPAQAAVTASAGEPSEEQHSAGPDAPPVS